MLYEVITQRESDAAREVDDDLVGRMGYMRRRGVAVDVDHLSCHELLLFSCWICLTNALSNVHQAGTPLGGPAMMHAVYARTVKTQPTHWISRRNNFV